MITEKDKHKLSILILELVEGSITDERLEMLDCWLDQSAEALSFYRSFFKTSVSLKRNLSLYQPDEQENFAESQLWETLAQEEKTAPAIEIVQERAPQQPVHVVKLERPPRVIQKSSVFAVIVSVAAILLVVLMVLVKPVVPTVASLTDSMNAEWDDVKYSPATGDVLRQGRWNLTKGLAEVTFDNGAVVVIEAPAIFELESAKSMYLDSGKISAYVSRFATGFTVNTPSASIVDLGTEFGVDVQYDGTCDLHMFTGKANLVVGQEGQEKNSQMVNGSEARNVDGRTGRVRNIALQDNRFVRRIDSETGLVWKGQDFDLADVVGGGNGFGSGDWRMGLNPATGEFSSRIPQAMYVNKVENYTAAKDSALIDGVFIPDSSDGDVIITSQGHLFEECPDTADTNRCYGFIRTGGNVLTNLTSNDYRELILDGVRYDGQSNPVIFMHTNSGLTFDLQAIRESLPQGASIERFTALCGVSDDTPETDKWRSDFWVLVDGQLKFDFLAVRKNTPGQVVDIPIGPEDRYLTLITTDAGDSTANDYCLFARPVLELK